MREGKLPNITILRRLLLRFLVCSSWHILHWFWLRRQHCLDILLKIWCLLPKYIGEDHNHDPYCLLDHWRYRITENIKIKLSPISIVPVNKSFLTYPIYTSRHSASKLTTWKYFIIKNSFIKTDRINFINFYALVSFWLEPIQLWEAKYFCTYRTFQIFKPPLSRYKQTLVASVIEEENTKCQSAVVCVCTGNPSHHISTFPLPWQPVSWRAKAKQKLSQNERVYRDY